MVNFAGVINPNLHSMCSQLQAHLACHQLLLDVSDVNSVPSLSRTSAVSTFFRIFKLR